MEIHNDFSTMVSLWLRLERTEVDLRNAFRRFCPRTVLKLWFPDCATDDFIWEVCHIAEVEGYEQLPPVRSRPAKHYDFLLAIVAVCCGIGKRAVNTRDLVAAYRHVFPNNAPLNKGKKALTK